MTDPAAGLLGVDIGGTHVRVALVTAHGDLLARRTGSIPSEGDPEALTAHLRDLLTELRAEVTAQPELAGVALPGVWDPMTSIMRKAVNLPRLEGCQLRELFETALDMPVRLEADANAAIWGQWRALDPRPSRLLYLSLGTGVGGSAILDGRIVRHTRNGPGHFGYLIVDTSPDAPAGRNNVPGCLSAIASGPALHLAATGETDPQALGDEELPAAVLERAARALSVAFLNLTHLYAPEMIMLGGGVVDHHPQLVSRAQALFRESRSGLIPLRVTITRAPLSTHTAGVIGAALLAYAAARGDLV